MKKTYHIELMNGATVIAQDLAVKAAFENGDGQNAGIPSLFERLQECYDTDSKRYPTTAMQCVLSQEDHKLVMYRDGKIVMVIEEREEFELPTLPADTKTKS